LNERAYYNENDEFAAAWLAKVIARGLIAPGDVDSRSIVDVRSDDVKEYRQCHFFAGIGVWSHALRLAGWTDDRRVWTGSCPCGPFSGAGLKLGFNDERHLWPEFFRLIRQCRPRIILGEQVASPNGLAWIDLVQSDLENENYASAAIDLCAAGVGAPHIRQRLYWVAHANGYSGGQGRPHAGGLIARSDAQPWPGSGFDRGAGILVDRERARLERHAGHGDGPPRWPVADRPVATAGSPDVLADAADRQFPIAIRRPQGRDGNGPDRANAPTGPVNGVWRNADWLLCRDGKWRAVEPGTFPLVNGAAARVGRLRGYGNAIVAQVAQEFIEAVMEVMP
jgi:DNA (cytosine-5)-methyltransferase 1